MCHVSDYNLSSTVVFSYSTSKTDAYSETFGFNMILEYVILIHCGITTPYGVFSKVVKHIHLQQKWFQYS